MIISCPSDKKRYNKKAEIVTLNDSQNQNCHLKEDFPPYDCGGWGGFAPTSIDITAYGVLEGVPLICGERNWNGNELNLYCNAIGHPYLKIQMVEERRLTS